MSQTGTVHSDPTDTPAGPAADTAAADAPDTDAPDTDGPDTDAADAGPTGSGAADPGAGGSQSAAGPTARLEREGDVAADYLEELLDIADLDGDIDIEVDGGRAVVALVGDGLGHLVGRDGAVLTALQDLTRLAVTRQTGDRSRLVVDVDGYRARRRGEIESLARDAAARVRDGGEPVALPAMGAFERKIAHDAVAALGLASGSEGEDPRRHVVVRSS